MAIATIDELREALNDSEYDRLKHSHKILHHVAGVGLADAPIEEYGISLIGRKDWVVDRR
jgi:hypothetical protein